jgi:CubicO group peptidase (beta-lactamase class C family)
LFGTARDAALAGEWYLGALRGRATPIDAALAREAVREQASDPLLRRGLGWALKTRDDNSSGALMSPQAFGHTGFTGTSVWVDPERDCSVTLLTNAVHYGRSDLRSVRAEVADAALRALDGAS